MSATAGDVFTYPDVTIVCGEPLFGRSGQDTLLNPLVIVEVLSDSTEAYDRGKPGSHAAPRLRGEHYRAIPSVHDYVLVAQNQILVEHFSRQPDGTWSYADHRSSDTITLTVCDLVVADIYLKVLEHDAA